MIIDKPVFARPTIVGQYNFHYPNHEGEGIVVPKGSDLSELPWTSSDAHRAYLWEGISGARVVWIKDENKSRPS
jgi:hypothetical protein